MEGGGGGGEDLPWLKYVKLTLSKLGLEHFWNSPSDQIPDHIVIREKFCNWLLHENISISQGPLTERFLDIKLFPAFEGYLDMISPAFCRSLYIRLRLGCLRLLHILESWKLSLSDSSLCPACLSSEETLCNFLFFCPRFLPERKRWRIPLFRLLGIREFSLALRFC